MNNLDGTHEVLPNGLRFIWLDLPHVHQVCLLAALPGGVAYETPANNGVSHLLEHLHMAVARRYPAQTGARPALFSSCGAHTEPDKLLFILDVAPAQAADAAELLADVLARRPFPPDLIASEKRVVTDEIKGRRDRDLRSWLFRGHSFGLPPAGTARSVNHLTREQIEGYDRTCFEASNIVVAAVGPVAGCLERVRAALAALPGQNQAQLAAPVSPALKLPLIRRHNRLRRDVTLGFIVDGELSRRERVALYLAARGLSVPSAALYQRVRYGPTGMYRYTCGELQILGSHVWWAWGVADGSRQIAFIRAVLEEINGIRTGQVNPDWFASLKQEYLRAHESASDEPDRLAYRLAKEELHEPRVERWSITEELAAVAETSPNDLVALMRERFTRERFLLFYDTRPVIWIYDRFHVRSLSRKLL